MSVTRALLYSLAALLAAHVALVWIMAIRRGFKARQALAARQPTTPGTWPFVSVIVPAWRERGTLEQCLAALRQVDYPAWEAVIVAGGPDGTYQAALAATREQPQARVIEQRPRGKNAALNEGAQVARGDVLVFLDADSRVSPGWLRALVAALDEGDAVVVGRPVALRQSAVSRVEAMERIAAWEIGQNVILQGSGSIALRRATLEAIHGLPEDVLVGVDWDLSARLAERGVPRRYAAEATVYTERPATWGEYWRNELRWRRAHLASLLRLRDHFLGRPQALVSNLYLYGLAWGTLGLTAAAVIGAIFGAPGVVGLWAVWMGWLTLRRAALAAEIAAYTGQARWLADSWAPPVALLLTLLAACVASTSLRRSSMHFRGPRTVSQEQV